MLMPIFNLSYQDVLRGLSPYHLILLTRGLIVLRNALQSKGIHNVYSLNQLADLITILSVAQSRRRSAYPSTYLLIQSYYISWL